MKPYRYTQHVFYVSSCKEAEDLRNILPDQRFSDLKNPRPLNYELVRTNIALARHISPKIHARTISHTIVKDDRLLVLLHFCRPHEEIDLQSKAESSRYYTKDFSEIQCHRWSYHDYFIVVAQNVKDEVTYLILKDH